jgi:hypothetical protein
MESSMLSEDSVAIVGECSNSINKKQGEERAVSSTVNSATNDLTSPSSSNSLSSTSSIVSQKQTNMANDFDNQQASTSRGAVITVEKVSTNLDGENLRRENSRRSSKDDSSSDSQIIEDIEQKNDADVVQEPSIAHESPHIIDRPHIFHSTPPMTVSSIETRMQMFSNLKPTEDAWDILFARAEGLHAHGHGREACILAVRLAEQMLAHPPNLMIEIPPPPKRKGKKHINPISHQVSVLASATLSKCAFLCNVLADNSDHYHIAFRVCLFGLEMPRPPASTKPLEVKLANQESDLLALLKKIPLGAMELKVS